MEYKKDKRTKNLTLRDIHVGDWVQVWSEQAERYSPPLKIIQICDDGTVYLIIDEENRLDPWEENIKDIDALPITPDLLKGFGFDIEMYNNGEGKIRYDGDAITFLRKEYQIGKDCLGILCDIETGRYTAFDFLYMHEFIAYTEEILEVKLEWKGVDK